MLVVVCKVAEMGNLNSDEIRNVFETDVVFDCGETDSNHQCKIESYIGEKCEALLSA